MKSNSLHQSDRFVPVCPRRPSIGQRQINESQSVANRCEPVQTCWQLRWQLGTHPKSTQRPCWSGCRGRVDAPAKWLLVNL